MAKHKFDGRWNYFEMPHDDSTTVPSDGPDMILAIPDEGGDVDADHSTQDGHRLDGHASNRRLDLERTEEGNTRTLNGRVVFEEVIDQVRYVVIVGRFVDRDKALRAQNEGTWIVTKP